ncbi:sugar phosphate isomerase/epimerase family protein [candidate division KSB1 bacterium]
MKTNRRNFLKTSLLIPLTASGIAALKNNRGYSQEKVKRTGAPRIKVSLNAYSFNKNLRSGEMSLDDILELCAELEFDGLDPTGYYFPNYPGVPDDEYIYHIKKKAFLLGIDLTGTGVRNDFTNPDPGKRKADVQHIKEWMEVASKLGIPALRVFAGKKIPEGYTKEEVTEWVIEGIKQAAEHGRKHGVMAVIQNHDDFLKTSDEVLNILKKVNSKWVGLMVDTGSFSQKDPYEEIAKVAPYAVTWQIKRLVNYGDRMEKINLKKIVKILRDANYRGYIPIEHIGKGDPKIIIPQFLKEVRQAIG